MPLLPSGLPPEGEARYFNPEPINLNPEPTIIFRKSTTEDFYICIFPFHPISKEVP